MNSKGRDVTLLLVEDDDIDAMTIERAFEKQRISNPLIRACDGIEALEMLRLGVVQSPYIILLDLQMPRMNGLEFLAEIRKDKELASSTVFVLTTSKTDKDMTASYKKHIAGYFVKDHAGDEFLDIISLFKGYWRVVHFPEKS